MEALVGLIEAITKNWSVFLPIYFPLFNNNNEKRKKQKKQIRDSHFPIPSVWLRLFSCFHTAGFCREKNNTNTWKWREMSESTKAERWRWQSCSLRTPRAKKSTTDPGDDQAFSHLVLNPKSVQGCCGVVVFAFEQICASIGQKLRVVFNALRMLQF